MEQTLDEPALTAAQLQRLGEVCRAQDNRLRIDVIQRLWELPMPDSESSFAEGIVDGTVVPRDTIIRGTLVNCGAMTNDVFQADLTDISLLHDLPVDSFLQTTLAPIIRAIFGEESNVVDASATFTDDTAAAWDMKDGSVAAWDMEDVSSEDRPAAYHFSSGSNVIEVEVVERRTESETANDGVSVEDARAAVSNAGAFARIFDRMHSLLQ